MFDCAIIPANLASGRAKARESARRAMLFVYFMMRAWGLKAKDLVGLDRPYEGAAGARMGVLVAEKVMKAQDIIRKLRPKAMVDGVFGQKGKVIHGAAVSFPIRGISLFRYPLFFSLTTKKRKRFNYDNFRGCR